MACNCRNVDGTLSRECLGACVKLKASIINQQESNRDTTNGLVEIVLGRANRFLEDKFSELKIRLEIEQQREVFELYKEAFVDGIKAGIKLSVEIDKDY